MKTKHKYIAVLFVSVLSDRVITTFFWQFEANERVTDLGLVNWWILSLFVLVLYAFGYYLVEGTSFEVIARLVSVVMSLFHFSVFFLNILVIIAG